MPDMQEIQNCFFLSVTSQGQMTLISRDKSQTSEGETSCNICNFQISHLDILCRKKRKKTNIVPHMGALDLM